VAANSRSSALMLVWVVADAATRALLILGWVEKAAQQRANGRNGWKADIVNQPTIRIRLHE
jgi:hypothetical protein